MNCRNCGAPPRIPGRCEYCGTVSGPVSMLVATYETEGRTLAEIRANRDALVEALRQNGRAWAVVPEGQRIDLLATPTPGQRMRV